MQVAALACVFASGRCWRRNSSLGFPLWRNQRPFVGPPKQQQRQQRRQQQTIFIHRFDSTSANSMHARACHSLQQANLH